MRNTRIAALTGTVATTAVAAVLLGATPALAQDDDERFDSAYAFSASGLVDVDPLPYVESRDGELVRDELVGIGERTDVEDAGIFLGLLTVEAEAHRAATSVARVELLDILRADLIRTSCEDDEGSLEIVNGTVLGEEVPENPVPPQEADGSPLFTLTFNDQTRNADGSLTVTGVQLTLLPGRDDTVDEELDAEDRAALPVLGDLLGVELPTDLGTESEVVDELTGLLGVDLDDALQTVTIGSVTCTERGDGGGDDHDGTDGHDGEDEHDPADHDDEEHDAAPRPAVVEASLPVTG